MIEKEWREERPVRGRRPKRRGERLVIKLSPGKGRPEKKLAGEGGLGKGRKDGGRAALRVRQGLRKTRPREEEGGGRGRSPFVCLQK